MSILVWKISIRVGNRNTERNQKQREQGWNCPSPPTVNLCEADGVVQYAVANIPGVRSFTSTEALTDATFPNAIPVAGMGWEVCLKDHGFAGGVNATDGKISFMAMEEGF